MEERRIAWLPPLVPLSGLTVAISVGARIVFRELEQTERELLPMAQRLGAIGRQWTPEDEKRRDDRYGIIIYWQSVTIGWVRSLDNSIPSQDATILSRAECL